MAARNDAMHTVKRRGLIAGAAALVAGIAAKQTSQPVAAASTAILQAADNLGSPINRPGSVIVINDDNFTNPAPGNRLFEVTAGAFTPRPGIGGIQVSISNGDLNSIGISGYTGSVGIGVKGTNTNGVGVYGQVTGGYGVYGISQNIGVYGSSGQGTGVYGQTSASNYYGVLGTTYAPSSTAIAGTCTQDGSSAFSGGTGNANAFAAYFQGHVQVDGPFDVIGAGNKHAAVAHPDGSHRTIYSIEAPEAWVEDFGTGTLAAGKADVKIDPDFAALIHTEDYHVFLTEHGGTHHHVSVATKTPGGFTVEADGEIAKLKGKAAADLAGTFSWRVVARPKTTAKVGRLAKVQIADGKALLPDPAKLPKPQTPLEVPALTPRGR